MLPTDRFELDHQQVDLETGLLGEKKLPGSKRNSSSGDGNNRDNEENNKRRRSDSDENDEEVNNSGDEYEGDDSDENDSESDEGGNNNNTNSLEALIGTVTLENLNFLRRLVQFVEQIYFRQQREKAEAEAQAQVVVQAQVEPEEEIDQDKANLEATLAEFLPLMTIRAIHHRNQDLNDWRKLTTDILVEIYGKKLAFLSAKGSRGAQGIDAAVYRAVYDLVNTRLGWILPSKDYVRHINKVCSNRKKTMRNRIPAGFLPVPTFVSVPFDDIDNYNL